MESITSASDLARASAIVCATSDSCRLPRCLTMLLGVALACQALPVPAEILQDDLTSLSLEELGNIRITSVSKRPERLADAAASVFVITNDDIRRSGARSLPDVLRLAPNLQVFQASSYGYAISARGMARSNTSAPNKLLVLIDGRSVYTPLFSGVFWDVQDVVLDDVERIEVISGPGGTLWGVNAVNGVINIVTRRAGDTQGTLLSGGAGNRGSDVAVRYGAPLGSNGHFRVYGKYLQQDHTSTASGSAVDDARHMIQAGFRADWSRANDQVSLQGNVYDGSQGQPAPGAISVTGVDVVLGDIPFSGVNLTANWNHSLAGGGNIEMQAYYDRTERTTPPMFGETLDIVDFQIQHTLQGHGIHSLAWGANIRHSKDRVVNSPYFAFLPARLDQDWASLFLQDEMALRDDLRLTLGARMERNDYTGTEFLPNARLAWAITPEHLLWTAASRAVRAPSRLDHDAYIPGAPPFLLNGGNEVRSEVAEVYEVGYRGQLSSRFTLSGTVFHNEYDDLRTVEVDPGLTFLLFGNGMRGRATGLEMWGTYQAAPSWRLSGGFTALDETFWLKPGSDDATGPLAAGNDPSHTWQLRSSWSFSPRGEFDLGLRHVSALESNDIPAYTAVDARFGWRLRDGLELSLSGRNLFGRHAETGALATRSELGPDVFAAVTWRM
jgi:iron complex outermembrane recepter protein